MADRGHGGGHPLRCPFRNFKGLRGERQSAGLRPEAKAVGYGQKKTPCRCLTYAGSQVTVYWSFRRSRGSRVQIASGKRFFEGFRSLRPSGPSREQVRSVAKRLLGRSWVLP